MDSDSILLQQICLRRGFDYEAMTADLLDYPDETLLENVERASERIRQAMFRNQPLVIFGHDDPDGITSTYVLYRFLNALGYQRHHYYIPNRNREMHGIQKSIIDFIREGGYPLMITVDNGISSVTGVEELKALGCDVIILDHHLIQPEQLPLAYAIVNPQLPDCRYPFKSLAGVGVILMFVRYLSKAWQHPLPESYYFWVAVGSLADKVPMVGVNWKIVRYVIDNWELMHDPSIDFLLRNHSRINNQTDIFNFIQNTARLLANGRADGGKHLAMDFLFQMGDDKARLFELLEAERTQWESELYSVFRLMDSLTQDFEGDAFVYYDDENAIPYSLLGTAASYVVTNIRVPTLMLKIHNGNMTCEGRCIDGFNVVEAFRWCKEYLIQYGGHAKAAGFTMNQDNYNQFIEAFHEYVAQNDPTLGQEPHCACDARVGISELTPRMWNRLEELLPFGQKFAEPVIRITGVTANDLQPQWTLDTTGGSIPGNGLFDVCAIWKSPSMMKLTAVEKHREQTE